MTEIVNQDVIDGIARIKDSKRCNMNDTVTVLKIARQWKHLHLADLIMDDEAKYFRCLHHGAMADTVVEEISTAETAVVEEDVEIREVAKPAPKPPAPKITKPAAKKLSPKKSK